MTIPENILVAWLIVTVFSLLGNSVLISLLVAYVNTERDNRMRGKQ